MILVDERGIAFVAPRFRVEMQAEDEVRTQPRINQLCPVPDLAGPVEEDFTLPPDCLLLERVVRSVEILARILRSTRTEQGAGGCLEIIGPEWSHWFCLIAHK